MARGLLLLLVFNGWLAVCSSQTVSQSRWKWPDDRPPPPLQPQLVPVLKSGSPGPARTGAGRLIPSITPTDKFNAPIVQQPTPKPFVPLPIRPPIPAAPNSNTSPVQEAIDGPDPVDTRPKNSSVPLLKDAGKPGNPYVLLNDIFPPEKSIRTQEQEDENLQKLLKADLGGLSPEEVYLADNDLFVVRGFNYKKDYTADPPGPPIDNYVAPAPNPPPAPEPGTVFYPQNSTGTDLPQFFPDFNGTDVGELPPFFPFIPAGLNETGSPGFFPGFPPFPFLPPPPPHWDSEKEFNNEINQQGGQPPNLSSFPLPPAGPQSPPFPPFFNGTQAPPPPTGLPPSLPPGFPNAGAFPPGAGPVPPNQGGGPPAGLPPFNGTDLPEDFDENVPFTPLFPERPVEYYFPTHNTTEVPPGPNGPGIFVPPPLEYFASRNQSDQIDVDIPPALFQEPFNLPNYYEVTTSRPAPTAYPAKEFKPLPIKTNISPSAVTIGPPALPYRPLTPTLPPHVKVVPGPGPIHINIKGTVESVPGPYFNYRPLNPPTQRPLYNPALAKGISSPYKFRPISLESDTDVNHRHPRPPFNLDSEPVSVQRAPAIGEAPRWPPTRQRPSTYIQPQPLQRYQYDNRGGPIEHKSAVLPADPPIQQHPTSNFVTVYRFGGGSYTYNLSGKRR